MPNNHLSAEWFDSLYDINMKSNSIVYDGDWWLGVKNIKFFSGMPDPKYNYKIKNHLTFFTKESAKSIDELTGGSVNELIDIQSQYFDDNFYIYWNAKVTRTVTRLHFHCLEWDLDNDGHVKMLD